MPGSFGFGMAYPGYVGGPYGMGMPPAMGSMPYYGTGTGAYHPGMMPPAYGMHPGQPLQSPAEIQAAQAQQAQNAALAAGTAVQGIGAPGGLAAGDGTNGNTLNIGNGGL